MFVHYETMLDDYHGGDDSVEQVNLGQRWTLKLDVRTSQSADLVRNLFRCRYVDTDGSTVGLG